MSQATYQICSNCIMDTSDPNITFDERGWCDYCRNFYKNIQPNWHPNEKGETMIAPLIDKIKRDGKGRDHDCLIGISGGLDSSYVTYIAKEKFGLRPLMFHCDTGWNSQVGVHNIESIIECIHTLFPLPVAPAIKRCGIGMRSVQYTRPSVVFPSPNAIFDFIDLKVSDSRISRNPTRAVFEFGISIPTAALPGIGATMRILDDFIVNERSFERLIIEPTFTPGESFKSYRVIIGPGLISVTFACILKLARALSSRAARDTSSFSL